jgi:colicin import membrane protein
MKTGQVAKKYGYSWLRRNLGLGLAVAMATVICVPSVSVRAALSPATSEARAPSLGLWTVAQATAPPGDAVVPPVKREAPQVPAGQPAPAAAPQPVAPVAAPPVKKPDPLPQAAEQKPSGKAPPPPPEFSGVFGTIQDWLARANREYQGVVVKELSKPDVSKPDESKPAGDEIAKKLKEQEAEAAAKIAAKKREEEVLRQAAEAKAAADAKSQDAKKLDQDRKKAEETKRLADEAKKKADEIFKSEAEKKPEAKPEAKKPEVAAPAAPAAPKPDDTARLEAEKKQAEQQKLEAEQAEAQKREAQKQAEEAKRQEQAQKAAEARRIEDERKQAEALAKADAERRRQAEAVAQPNDRSRKFEIVPERLPAPVVRPVDPGSKFRPELSPSRTSRSREIREAEGDAEVAAPARERHRRVKIRSYSEATYRGINFAAYRGTAVKRWVRRDNGSGCSRAGRRISPPANYTVASGDSLWRISEKHYNEGRKYSKIYRANRSRIADPDLIYPCQRVLVPR